MSNTVEERGEMPTETSEKILRAADKLFAEVGYDAATTREIAELSGVNKALIHYHFKSKEALLERILDRYYERLADMLREAVQADGSMIDKLNNLVDAYVDFLNQNRNFSRTVQREAAGGKHVDRVRVHMAPIFQMGMELLQGAYPSTRSGDLAAEQLLVSFYGMVISYFTFNDVLEYLLGKDPLSEKGLNSRKRHLHRMIEIIDAAMSEGKPCAVKKARSKAG